MANSPPPPSPLPRLPKIKDGKLVLFGFCAASSLIWGVGEGGGGGGGGVGDGGLLFH